MPVEAFDDGLRIGVRRADREIVLADIVGEIDMNTVPRARAFLAQIKAEMLRHLIVDLLDRFDGAPNLETLLDIGPMPTDR